MGFKLGIVGLPNVGKSTLFNALTKSSVKASNFPFCTIEPNIGVLPVPDIRLYKLAQIVNPNKIIPTTIEFVDIAGLVKGASKGKGLGNKFLSKIRETEAICHVIRCFDNDNIIHISGNVNPAEDINLINTELGLSDLNTCKRTLYLMSKEYKKNNKKLKIELEILEKCLSKLETVGMLHSTDLTIEEKRKISYLNLLTIKPMIYIANVNENKSQKNNYLEKIYSIAKKEGSIVIPVCATLEANITDINYQNNNKFMLNFEFKENSINKIISAGYSILKLQTYFTVGSKEVRAWTVPIGTTAKEAAGKIHTDLKKGFIRAQIISYEDFINYKSEKETKKTGNIRIEGKDYIVKDGDIIKFLFKV